MKKLAVWAVALCMIILLPLTAAAEVRFEIIRQYIPKVTQVKGTNYLIIQSNLDGKYGVVTTENEEKIPCEYLTLAYLSNGFFYAGNGNEDVNSKCLVYQDGRRVSGYEYGAFKVYSGRWVVGYKLSPATEDNNHIKVRKEFYFIDFCDVYYVGDEVKDSYLVGTLEGNVMASAQVHGDYIVVENEAGGTARVYNKDFQVLPKTLENIKVPPYAVPYYWLLDVYTGEIIAEGFTRVKEAPLPTEMRLIMSRANFDGTQLDGIYDTKGNELVPIEYSIVSATKDYALVTNAEKKQGLYSLDEGRLIVPIAFDKIINVKDTVDPYVFNGYVMVENEGTRCYFDISKGEITCELNYDEETMKTLKRVGSVCYLPKEEGFTLIAADGQVTELDVDAIADTRGDGFLIVAKKGDFFGVIDWHGNEILPFYHKTAPVITDDSRSIIRVSTGSRIELIIRDQTPAEATVPTDAVDEGVGE